MKKIKVEFIIDEDIEFSASHILDVIENSNWQFWKHGESRGVFLEGDLVSQSQSDYKNDLPLQIVLSEKKSDR